MLTGSTHDLHSAIFSKICFYNPANLGDSNKQEILSFLNNLPNFSRNSLNIEKLCGLEVYSIRMSKVARLIYCYACDTINSLVVIILGKSNVHNYRKALSVTINQPCFKKGVDSHVRKDLLANSTAIIELTAVTTLTLQRSAVTIPDDELSVPLHVLDTYQDAILAEVASPLQKPLFVLAPAAVGKTTLAISVIANQLQMQPNENVLYLSDNERLNARVKNDIRLELQTRGVSGETLTKYMQKLHCTSYLELVKGLLAGRKPEIAVDKILSIRSAFDEFLTNSYEPKHQKAIGNPIFIAQIESIMRNSPDKKLVNFIPESSLDDFTLEITNKFKKFIAAKQYLLVDADSFKLPDDYPFGFATIVRDEAQTVSNKERQLIANLQQQNGCTLYLGDPNQGNNTVNLVDFVDESLSAPVCEFRQLSDRVYRFAACILNLTNCLQAIRRHIASGEINAKYINIKTPISSGVTSGQIFFNTPDINSALFHAKQKFSLGDIAIVVATIEQKTAISQQFPLVFMMHELSGLEFKCIISYNLLSNNHNWFKSATKFLASFDLKISKDNFLKHEEQFIATAGAQLLLKSIYVAWTRALDDLYLIEDKEHIILTYLKQAILSNPVDNHAKVVAAPVPTSPVPMLVPMVDKKDHQSLLSRLPSLLQDKVTNQQAMAVISILAASSDPIYIGKLYATLVEWQDKGLRLDSALVKKFVSMPEMQEQIFLEINCLLLKQRLTSEQPIASPSNIKFQGYTLLHAANTLQQVQQLLISNSSLIKSIAEDSMQTPLPILLDRFSNQQLLLHVLWNAAITENILPNELIPYIDFISTCHNTFELQKAADFCGCLPNHLAMLGYGEHEVNNVFVNTVIYMHLSNHLLNKVPSFLNDKKFKELIIQLFPTFVLHIEWLDINVEYEKLLFTSLVKLYEFKGSRINKFNHICRFLTQSQANNLGKVLGEYLEQRADKVAEHSIAKKIHNSLEDEFIKDLQSKNIKNIDYNWHKYKSLLSASMLSRDIIWQGNSTNIFFILTVNDFVSILKKYWLDIKEHISADILNKAYPLEGPCVGTTPFYWLCSGTEGRELINIYWQDFKHYVTTDLLHKPCWGSGKFQGLTPLLHY